MLFTLFFSFFFFRAIKSTVGGVPRPLLDLSAENFANLFNQAFESPLVPPFDPYLNSLKYILASYVIPYVGLVAYVGTNPNLNGYQSKRVSSSQISERVDGLHARSNASKPLVLWVQTWAYFKFEPVSGSSSPSLCLTWHSYPRSQTQ